MKPDKFLDIVSAKSKEKYGQASYGLCAPPTEAQLGLSILIDHLLGEDWYTVMPVCQEQINTEAIYQILKRFPEKKSLKRRIKDLVAKW